MYNLYYLTSTLDDRIYIGITNNPKKRYNDHLKYTIKKTHFNANWIRKTLNSGGEIKMNIALSDLTKESAIQLEIKMIELLKRITPDKITNTAQGGMGFNHKGVPHSEEHKKALEQAQPHKVRLPKDELYDLYVNKKLSKKSIGEIYGCGTTTIDRRLKEYNISIRETTNYKISYKLNNSEIIKMFIDENKTISEISKIFGIGMSGIRALLKRQNIDTGLNRFTNRFDFDKIKIRYFELMKMKIRRMKIYEILSNEFGASVGYISKIKFELIDK